MAVTLATSVVVSEAGQAVALSVSSSVWLAVGASGPSVHVAPELPETATGEALSNARYAPSHASPTVSVCSVVSPVLVTVMSYVTVSPNWICASWPAWRTLEMLTPGRVI